MEQPTKQTQSITQELFEPDIYLDRQGPGFFSILAKPSGRARQDSYELRLLPDVIKAVDPTIDTWITQATFDQANRRAVNLRDVGLLFVDLDTYKSQGLRDKTPEEQASLLLIFCSQEGIPTPSLILFSGRGLQAKWILDEAMGPANLIEWNQAQLALVKIMEPFAADMLAKDVSRVLRLDQTTNTKSGEQIRILYVAGGNPDCIARYSFEELRSILIEHFPELVKPTKPQTTQPTNKARILQFPQNFSLERLNWYRLYDIRDLWKMRGGIPEGYRELTLFWELNFLLKAKPVSSAGIWPEAQSIAAQIDKRWFHKEIQRSTLSTLYRKAQETNEGRQIDYGGKKYPPLYTPRNQTLIDLFQITSDEEQSLRTIISKGEKLRRKQEKRRLAGVRPREEYLRQSLSRLKPWVSEGVSRAWWYEKRRGWARELSYPQFGGGRAQPLSSVLRSPRLSPIGPNTKSKDRLVYSTPKSKDTPCLLYSQEKRQTCAL